MVGSRARALTSVVSGSREEFRRCVSPEAGKEEAGPKEEAVRVDQCRSPQYLDWSERFQRRHAGELLHQSNRTEWRCPLLRRTQRQICRRGMLLHVYCTRREESQPLPHLGPSRCLSEPCLRAAAPSPPDSCTPTVWDVPTCFRAAQLVGRGSCGISREALEGRKTNGHQ